MSPKNQAPPNGCQRRFEQQKPTYLAGKRCRPATKKSPKLVESPTEDGQSALLDATLCDATLSDASGRGEASVDFEQLGLTSNSTQFDLDKEGQEAQDASSVEIEKSPSKDIIAEKLKPMYLIEGKRAIVVDARPWPKRLHESVLDSYKDPNPKLTPDERRKQARRVSDQRSLDSEMRIERFRRRCVQYRTGIYCLPKSLLLESKARLFQWYQLPTDVENTKAPSSQVSSPTKVGK